MLKIGLILGYAMANWLNPYFVSVFTHAFLRSFLSIGLMPVGKAVFL